MDTIENNNNYWSTEKVNNLLKKADEEGLDYKDIDNPFYENDPELKKGNILWEYTVDEMEEIKKCASDVVYFADNYCKVMTDEGIQQIKLRDYQVQILRQYQYYRKNIFVSSRQSGKTITSSIFLLWYLLFNYEKNALIMANIGDTASELIDKIKIIIKGLPFFLKPGILIFNVMTLKFDNGCRIMAKTTTKTSAIGYAIHMLYMDEFAHINPNFINDFFRSVYPTISASQIARVIITSTPNGLNKFWEIYKGAVDGTNDFNPIKVEWWQVPGRDEEWKKKEISILGSEEDFNQEYGCQFLSSSRLLLDYKTLKQLKNNEVAFEHKKLIPFENNNIDYHNLLWHPKFDPTSVLEKQNQRFFIAIDIAGGEGGDYSVINIFKVIPQPISIIKFKKFFDDEIDFFSLIQIGIFRSNTVSIEELKAIIEILTLNILGIDNTKIVIEINYKGELIIDKLLDSEDFYEGVFIYTKHSEVSQKLKPGVKITAKTKEKYCYDLKVNIHSHKIIPLENNTIYELSNFGLSPNGTFTSQIGRDDIVMTLVNLNSVFEYYYFQESVSEIYDNIPENIKLSIEEKLKENEKKILKNEKDISIYNFLNNYL